MAQETEKLNYIYEWFTSNGIHGRIDNDYIPDEASALARINSFDFKAAKQQEIKDFLRKKIEAVSPPAQQLASISQALRGIRRQQEGQPLTPAQQSEIDAFINLEDATIAPLRARAKALVVRVDAMTDWQTIAEFDVAASW